VREELPSSCSRKAGEGSFYASSPWPRERRFRKRWGRFRGAKEIRDTHQKSVSFTTKGEGNDSHDLVGNLWKAFHDDDIDTIGAGASMGFLEDSLVVKLDYAYARSRSEIAFEKGADLTSSGGPMPALKTKLHSIGLTGTYRLNRNLSLGGGYRYENYESDDWQTDVELDASTAVLLMSGPVEDYEAHQATVFVTYHFGG